MSEEQVTPEEWTHPATPQAVRVASDGRVAVLILVRNLTPVLRDGEPYGYHHGDEVEEKWVLTSAANGVLGMEVLKAEDIEGWTEVYRAD